MIPFFSVLSLKCYQCRKCNDPFKTDGVKTVECPGVCLKTKVAADVGTYKKGGRYIMITSPCNVYPLTFHFYIVKLGFTGINIIFLFLL